MVVFTDVMRQPADPVPAFRDFVSNERDRLMKKKQALMKHEMDKRMADLVKFGQSFKVCLSSSLRSSNSRVFVSLAQ